MGTVLGGVFCLEFRRLAALCLADPLPAGLCVRDSSACVEAVPSPHNLRISSCFFLKNTANFSFFLNSNTESLFKLGPLVFFRFRLLGFRPLRTRLAVTTGSLARDRFCPTKRPALRLGCPKTSPRDSLTILASLHESSALRLENWHSQGDWVLERGCALDLAERLILLRASRRVRSKTDSTESSCRER